MAELVDAPDSKSGDGDIVRVRAPPSVPSLFFICSYLAVQFGAFPVISIELLAELTVNVFSNFPDTVRLYVQPSYVLLLIVVINPCEKVELTVSQALLFLDWLFLDWLFTVAFDPWQLLVICVLAIAMLQHSDAPIKNRIIFILVSIIFLLIAF